MAVLHPKQNALVGARGGQARIEVARPGIGIVGARQRCVVAFLPDGIERVFHDVVACGADRVQKQLARESRKIETLPDLAAVEDDGAELRRYPLPPRRVPGAAARPSPDLPIPATSWT